MVTQVAASMPREFEGRRIERIRANLESGGHQGEIKPFQHLLARQALGLRIRGLRRGIPIDRLLQGDVVEGMIRLIEDQMVHEWIGNALCLRLESRTQDKFNRKQIANKGSVRRICIGIADTQK